MAYIVIKTVKGRQYVYRQTSYRDGGKVRTRSEYIGPVNPVRGSSIAGKAKVAAALTTTKAGVVITTTDARRENEPVQPHEVPQPAAPVPEPSKPVPKRVITTRAKSRKQVSMLFRERVSLGKHGISAKSLQTKLNGLAKRLAAKGLDTNKMPPVGGGSARSAAAISG